MRKYATYLLVVCLLLCNCSGNASPIGGKLYALDDINLGADANSKAAALALHLMQIADLYTNRLARLEYMPDTSETRLAAAAMRKENELYISFLTGFAAALYNSRPIMGKALPVTITENGEELEFSITDEKSVRFEGKLDYVAAACYVFRYEGSGWQYFRFIADRDGYYLELISMDNGAWHMHKAYYSQRRWFNACGQMQSHPEPDTVYHFLPESFEQHLQGMPPLSRRMEYTYEKQLLYWDYSRGHELSWDLSIAASPTPVWE